MKKLLAVMLTGALAISLCACGSSSGSTDSSAQGSASQSDASEETASASNNTAAASASDLSSYQIQIDGTDYAFPMSYQEIKENLTADGWTADEIGASSLDANTVIKAGFSKGEDGSIEIDVLNDTDAAINPEDGTAAGIVLYSNSLDTAEITLPGGMVFNSDITADAVSDQYGEPNDGSDEEVMVYGDTDALYHSSQFEFHTDPDDGSPLVIFAMQNYPE